MVWLVRKLLVVSPCWQFHGRALSVRYIIPIGQAIIQDEAKEPTSTGINVNKGT